MHLLSLESKLKSQLKPPYTGVPDRCIRRFDREFDFDSQEWSCSNKREGQSCLRAAVVGSLNSTLFFYLSPVFFFVKALISDSLPTTATTYRMVRGDHVSYHVSRPGHVRAVLTMSPGLVTYEPCSPCLSAWPHAGAVFTVTPVPRPGLAPANLITCDGIGFRRPGL